MLGEILGIRQTDGAPVVVVHPAEGADLVQDGGNAGGVGQAGGLHEYILQVLLAQGHQGVHKGVLDAGAENGAVVQFHHLGPGNIPADQGAVHAGLAELVDDHAHPGVFIFPENVIEKGCLAGTQKAGQQDELMIQADSSLLLLVKKRTDIHYGLYSITSFGGFL